MIDELMKSTKRELADMVVALSNELEAQKKVVGTAIPLSMGLETIDANQIYKNRLQVKQTGEFNEQLNNKK
jgi:hypothetical protein